MFDGNGMPGINEPPDTKSGIGSGNATVALYAPMDAAVTAPFSGTRTGVCNRHRKYVPLGFRVSDGFDAFRIGAFAWLV